MRYEDNGMLQSNTLIDTPITDSQFVVLKERKAEAIERDLYFDYIKEKLQCARSGEKMTKKARRLAPLNRSYD